MSLSGWQCALPVIVACCVLQGSPQQAGGSHPAWVRQLRKGRNSNLRSHRGRQLHRRQRRCSRPGGCEATAAPRRFPRPPFSPPAALPTMPPMPAATAFAAPASVSTAPPAPPRPLPAPSPWPPDVPESGGCGRAAWVRSMWLVGGEPPSERDSARSRPCESVPSRPSSCSSA